MDAFQRAARDGIAALISQLESFSPASGDQAKPNAATVARRLYGERRQRDRYFGIDLFGEPAWDILLDLYISRCEGRTVSTKRACIGAATTASTAIRWLRRLEEAKLVRRRAAASGGDRVTLVEITPDAFERMTACLERAHLPDR
ncbi:MAG TPA: hypothetical protein VN240_09735 [Propylenella sp.]|nr:hypothetical protein [Propylenella sp.]